MTIAYQVMGKIVARGDENQLSLTRRRQGKKTGKRDWGYVSGKKGDEIWQNTHDVCWELKFGK